MGSTTVRIREQDHEEIRNIAELVDQPIPVVMSEVLNRVDLDEIRQEVGSGEPVAGLCPECGTEIPASNVETVFLSSTVTAHCPEAELDDDVHVEEPKGRYKLTELSDAKDE